MLGKGVRESGLALLAAGAALLSLAVGAETPLLRDLETASLDLRFRLRGPVQPGPETALIVVDDKSLAALGRWPFSRRLLARAVHAISDAGARVIVFDLLFSEPEQPISPSTRAAARDAAARLAGSSDGADTLRDALERIAADDPDAEMRAALEASGRVLLPYAFAFGGEPGDAPPYLTASAYQRFDRSPEVPTFPLRPAAIVTPLEPLARAAAGLGHVNIAFDRDGAPRYDYVALPFGADFYPSLPVRAVANYLGQPWSEVGLALGAGVRIGPRLIPTDRAMRMLINYRGPRGTFPTYSFVDAIEGRLPSDALRDRLVLVGAAAIGVNDTFRSPFGSAPLPGVERMASIVDTILRQDFIGRPPGLGFAESLAVLLLAALAGAATTVVPTRAAAFAGVMPMLLWAAAALAAFRAGVWLDLVAPEIAFAAALMAVLAFRYLIVERDGREIKSAFRHYLAPDLVNALAAHPERLRLGGETRPMTVMFCDVRNFTGLSEGMAPAALVQMMNRILTPATDIVMRHRGTVDKYIGDCVMAFWNAPLDDEFHARHACAAALDLLGAVDRLAGELADSLGGARLEIGIGVNSGPCLVGNLGSAQRFEYSVMGDTVNVASRLESLTKTYGVPLLVGDATREQAPDLPWLAIDEVAVRGRTAPVRIHTLWTGPEHQLPALAALHRRIIAARLEDRYADLPALIEPAAALAGSRYERLYQELARRRDRRAPR